MKRYPNWVEKVHTPGTSVKQIKDNYYLYSVTSKYTKDKPYPVSVQRYIGKITPDGLIEPDKITFIPTLDKLVLLKNIISLDLCTPKDLILIENLPILVIGSVYYTGRLNKCVEKVLTKYFNYENGVIYD